MDIKLFAIILLPFVIALFINSSEKSQQVEILKACVIFIVAAFIINASVGNISNKALGEDVKKIEKEYNELGKENKEITDRVIKEESIIRAK
ncbi:hypothetical protein [Terrisporobacter sp.]